MTLGIHKHHATQSVIGGFPVLETSILLSVSFLQTS